MTDEERSRYRREAHRRTWLELTFDPMPADIDAAVFELWLAGGTSTRVTMEILDVGEDELRRRALMRFAETTDEISEAIVRAWSTGRIGTAEASELACIDADGLIRLADRLGIRISRDDRRTS